MNNKVRDIIYLTSEFKEQADPEEETFAFCSLVQKEP
jgi:hypothetical protein